MTNKKVKELQSQNEFVPMGYSFPQLKPENGKIPEIWRVFPLWKWRVEEETQEKYILEKTPGFQLLRPREQERVGGIPFKAMQTYTECKTAALQSLGAEKQI